MARWVGEEPAPSQERIRAALYQNALLTIVVMAAFGGCIAIYGMVLAILGAPVRVWAPFFAVSFAHMLWQKTKREYYFQRAEERSQEFIAGYTGRES